MYTLQHAPPLVGPYVKGNSPDLLARLYLVAHLQSLGRDPRVDNLARRYHTRWIWYDRRVLPISHRIMNLAALRRNPNLSTVFHEGGTWIFRVRLPTSS
jgi:hypothetical protein